MKLFLTGLLAISLTACFKVEPSPIRTISGEGQSLALYESKCTLHPKGQHAVYTAVDGATQAACWIEQDGYIWVIYADGDRSQIPVGEAKKV